MLTIEVPGWGSFPIRHLVLDLNGTLTLDGGLMAGVRERIVHLAGKLDIHVLTADTLGKAAELCHDLPVTLHTIAAQDQVEAKRKYIRGLPLRAVAMGNGRNDAAMLADAALGIAVIGPEGASPEAVSAADVVVLDINDGLDLLIYPDRLKATLRS
ncbi:MAG: ATPase P [bacterium]|nr:ATPase P [bacterium]MDT8396422.1 ATPase P [bacterium]